jgi:RimJ/RimL family protein N-acetyltransferase
MTFGPTLETQRLILRPPTAEDFEPFALFMANPATAHFIGGAMVRSVAWRSLCAIAGGWVLQGFSMFSWIEKDSGRWIGRGGPWFPAEWPGPEVGWGVIAEAQGKGYAQEAAAAAIDWAFDALGWTEVIHCIDAANAPSIGVATALGSTVQRRAVAAPAPLVATWDVYGQSRASWRTRRAPAV